MPDLDTRTVGAGQLFPSILPVEEKDGRTAQEFVYLDN